jgi:predicted HAD superfamily Cof-like phosphohydrolase|tara:strand:+ start:4800 stop:5186 length:387 start_codon:yes stop_codon:yes gene_type:complete
MSNFEEVAYFMKTFGQEVVTSPTFPSKEIAQLRVELIEEELQELKDAIADGDMVEIADALTDILYVTYGAGHSYGLPLDKCFMEVQRSNMSKADENGNPIYREDGKIMKGVNYSEPDLLPLLIGKDIS